jgi:hypothetical protein
MVAAVSALTFFVFVNDWLALEIVSLKFELLPYLSTIFDRAKHLNEFLVFYDRRPMSLLHFIVSKYGTGFMINQTLGTRLLVCGIFFSYD